jgi:hypothetical protein
MISNRTNSRARALCSAPPQTRVALDFQTRKMKTPRRESTLANTCASPQKAVIIFLGTGWQRFRFRLGRPRAGAHVWGKGARILTEINRLPQLHCHPPAKTQRKIRPGAVGQNRFLARFQPPDSRPLLIHLDARRGSFDA